jgi:hypothetical protein
MRPPEAAPLTRPGRRCSVSITESPDVTDNRHPATSVTLQKSIRLHNNPKEARRPRQLHWGPAPVVVGLIVATLAKAGIDVDGRPCRP